MEQIGQFLEGLSTSKSVWTYIVFAILGLYGGIFITTIREKRWPKSYDFYTLIGYIPLVCALAILVGNSPVVSFLIGFAPDNTIKLLKALNLIKDNLPTSGLPLGLTQTVEDNEVEKQKIVKVTLTPTGVNQGANPPSNEAKNVSGGNE